MQQLELKVEVSKSDMKRLGGELQCEDLASELPPGTKQRAVHFDTPEHNLHAAGLSVWLRRRDGHWLQTINADRHAADGTSHVVELQSQVATREPDLAKIADKNVRRAAQKAVRGTSLNPVFETVVQRTSRKIETQSGKPPLALDGGAQTGKGATDVSDAVLELKAGSADGLLLAVEKLLGPHELKLARHSKIERAYRLPKQSEARAKPEKARPARIARKNTCREAVSAILASAIEQITVNRQAALHTDDPEGAHQFRIGLRRLRSAPHARRRCELSRPGGNVTGVTTLAGDLFEKRLGLLHELAPAVGSIAYLVNPTNLAFPNMHGECRKWHMLLGLRYWS